MAKKKQA
jgi:hypothetical protein